MATEVSVNSTKMTSDAQSITELVQSTYNEKVDLAGLIIALHDSWQGEANSAFETAVSEDMALIDDLLQELATLASKMSEGASIYVNCVNEISNNIGLYIAV